MWMCCSARYPSCCSVKRISTQCSSVQAVWAAPYPAIFPPRPGAITCAAHHPDVAVLCIPRAGAKAVAPTLVEAGVKGYWNFSHYDLSVDYEGITVENVHLGDSLMSLGYRVRND